jgi:hypothetical protein
VKTKKNFNPPRRFDLLSEMVRFTHKAERSVPMLKLEDLLRDKPKTTAVSMH